MFIIEYLAKLIKVLRSGDTPEHIAWGFILGMMIGLTPIFTLHNLIILFLIIVLNVNLSMALFSFLLFSGIAYIFDPLFHSLGYYLLVELSTLETVWNFINSLPLLAVSKYNNTVNIGSLCTGILLLIPMYFLSKYAVVLYREKIDSRFQKLKIVQSIKGSKIFIYYEKIRDWRE